jgi:LacI family transcriptional regulator
VDAARGRLTSLADVARKAGVSITTASRVMSESSHPVAERTRERVRAAADELDFEPNLVARGLVAHRTSMVAVLVDDLTDPAAALVARGVEDDAFEHGFSVVVGDTDGDPAKEVAYVRKLRALRADAVLLATAGADGEAQRDELARQLRQVEGGGGVVVRLGPDGLTPCDVAWSRREAFDLAVAHLVGLGHREVALVVGRAGRAATAAVTDACRAAMDAAGLALPRERILAMADQPDDAARAAGVMSGFTPIVTAVITTTDEDAAALIACLQAGGRRVPEDVSVCSLGDLPVAAVVSPALTTVRLPLRESGRVGMSRARDALEGVGPGMPTELPVELIVRDSTGPVPV